MSSVSNYATVDEVAEHFAAEVPAFPSVIRFRNGTAADTGMTLRDYFAAKALEGMCAGLTRFRTEPGMEDIIANRPDDVSSIAYVYADAMLAARSA